MADQDITHFSSILSRYQDKVPVPVVAIAKELGISIYETDDFNDTQSGSIRKESDRYTIYLNAKQSPIRKRFTIAHEIGHFIKHRSEIDKRCELVDTIKQSVTKVGLKRSEDDGLSAKDKRMETEANNFAAELLMPEEAFRQEWQNTTAIEDLAAIFNVSVSAAAVRAKELLGSFIM